jgi:hypothetical protein
LLSQGAAVAITLEVYLTHQVIRGSLRDDSGHRVIDILNTAQNQIVTLSDALAASMHAQAPPSKLSLVRIRRPQILLVVPQSVETLPPRRFRVGFVEKRPFNVGVGIGPFVVTGTIHTNTTEPNPITSLEHDPSGRFFLPITQARISSLYDPRWSLNAELVFLNRAAIASSYPHDSS